ncbi:uncharacterized protein FIESC28_04078 [Fusarium coffeatum]|uniref:Uncharacterized protein n=1 Tax=Fusarium coffeatum TaxID=231269 RepID=A0A366S194_9HYPO|nr:uncharacterized protein FIESC28_04078 [Fusarium coffeatum]RBR23083.1 hypothetical protein FIESC28_04078 [Fusarium coffeatum]
MLITDHHKTSFDHTESHEESGDNTNIKAASVSSEASTSDRQLETAATSASPEAIPPGDSDLQVFKVEIPSRDEGEHEEIFEMDEDVIGPGPVPVNTNNAEDIDEDDIDAYIAEENENRVGQQENTIMRLEQQIVLLCQQRDELRKVLDMAMLEATGTPRTLMSRENQPLVGLLTRALQLLDENDEIEG